MSLLAESERLRGANSVTAWRRDGQILGLVIAGFVAARLLFLVPWTLVVVVVLVGIVLLRPGLGLIALLLAIGAHSGVALDGLDASATRPMERESVRLVEDPRPSQGGWRVVALMKNEHVVLTARLPASAQLRDASAGDALELSGTLRGERPQTSWAIGRQIVGRVSVSEIHGVEHAGGATGLANVVRKVIEDGADSIPFSRRVLFTGLVFGDDRGQDVIVADNFRAAGLGHLLAVSGQNVVFVLLLAAPLLTRIRSTPLRVSIALLILLSFGFLTRFEASVTRALVMAGLALLAHAVGRPAGAAAVLPPAVLGLLLLDPLLAWSLAFQLSVAATVGLIVLTPRLAEVLRGPEALRLAAAATLSAQLFVSPLLFATFGQVSVVAMPANLLAAPAAAGTMMWGLVAGPVAGVGPPWLGALIHLPTRVMLWWIDGVAAWAARIEVGHATPWHLAAVVLGAIGWHTLESRRWFTAAIATAAVASVLIAPRPLPPGEHVLASGVTVARSVEQHDVLIIGADARADELVEVVRQARLGRIDLVIAEGGSRTVGQLVALIDRRFEVTDIWAPNGHQVPGARVVDPLEGEIGSLAVRRANDGSIEVLES